MDLHTAVADVAARLLVVLHGAGGDGGLLALHEGTDGMDFCDISNFHIFRDRLCALGGSGRGQADEQAECCGEYIA